MDNLLLKYHYNQYLKAKLVLTKLNQHANI